MAESDQAEDPSRPTATERQPRPGRSAESSHSQGAGDSSAGRPPVAPPDVKMGSETETESEDDNPAGATSSGVGAQTANDLHRDSSARVGSRASNHSSRGSLPASGDQPSASQVGSQSPESPAGSRSRSPPPSKKPKLNATRRVEDSDSDSDDSRAGRASQASQSNAGAGRGRGGPARGVRQPLKRGVKRF